MQYVSNEIELPFEVTFDSSSLNVGLSVYDVTSSPVLIAGPTAMVNVVGNTYLGKFTPQFGKRYLVTKNVYTDNLLNVLNTDYANMSEAFVCQGVKLEAGQLVVKKNKAFNNFSFLMVDVVNQNPIVGLTVAAQRSIDGASFVSCDNSVIEIGLGFYKINLTANDLNGDVIALTFSSLGADTTALTILTQA